MWYCLLIYAISVAGDPRLRNRKRYPTTSPLAPLTSNDVLVTIEALMTRFKWGRVGLLCDVMSHLPGLANFYFAACRDVKNLFTRMEYVWWNIDFDTKKEQNFTSHLTTIRKNCRSLLLTYTSVNQY